MVKRGKVKNGKVIPTSKDLKIIKELKDNPYGLTVNTLKKLTSLPTRTLYNHLNKLKKANIVQNIFPIWKIWHSSDLMEKLAKLPESSKLREQGHKMIWILPLIKKPYWWNKRKDRFMKLKDWQYKSEVIAHNNVYHQIQKDNMQIQAFKNSIYFICNTEYLENHPAEVFNKAKDDVLNAINFIEEKFRFKFIAEGNFHLTIVDSHYVTLKDALSQYLYKEQERFRITTKEGYHLWVDFSEPLGTESDNPEVKRRYLKHYKDIIDTPNLPVPSELTRNQLQIQGSIKDLINIQKTESKKMGYYAKTIEKHIGAIDKLGNEVSKLTDLNIRLSEIDKRQRPPTPHISEDLRFLLNHIRKPKDVFKYKAKIILLPKEEKRILERFLFNLSKV